MFSKIASLLASAAAVSAVAIPIELTARATGASVTPHDRYSSSIGVLGCKIDTNRVAYWPTFPGCDNLCVKVNANGRSVYLLRIDQSGGAYDISYDAWNYLVTGQSATVNPQYGGGISANYEERPMSECVSAGLLSKNNGKLPLTAANSMNYVSSCLSQPSSWVAQNYELYNIFTPVCTYGIDEKCTLNLAVSNQPSCPHQLGLTTPLDEPVWNIDYGTGKLSKAL